MKMSRMDPRDDQYLRSLARRSRTGTLSSNEAAELDTALKQSGPLSRELQRIIDGKG
jgi:hypothetical protein